MEGDTAQMLWKAMVVHWNALFLLHTNMLNTDGTRRHLLNIKLNKKDIPISRIVKLFFLAVLLGSSMHEEVHVQYNLLFLITCRSEGPCRPL